MSQWEEVQTILRQESVELVQEKTTKPIKIKLRRQDTDTDDLVQRVNQETTEEEVEDKLVEALQRRPRKTQSSSGKD